ncbi:MAG: hypothetical protein Rubg2KO_01920 [Rubricoccaceae bacterium]
MRRLALFALVPLLLVLSGCFQVFSTLTVRADGSAQLEERLTFEGMAAMAMLEGFTLMDDSTNTPESGFETRAATLGEGVTLSNVERLIEPGQLTYVVTYDVPDVSALTYSFDEASNPDGIQALASNMGADEDMSGEEMGIDSTAYTFAFEPARSGQAATLSIVVPESRISMLDEIDPGEMNLSEDSSREFDSAMVMMGRARMQFAVVVEGEQVDADGGWTDGNRVTLTELAMSDFMTFAKTQVEAGDFAPLLQITTEGGSIDLPGLRAVAPGTVQVRFQ